MNLSISPISKNKSVSPSFSATLKMDKRFPIRFYDIFEPAFKDDIKKIGSKEDVVEIVSGSILDELLEFTTKFTSKIGESTEITTIQPEIKDILSSIVADAKKIFSNK